MDQNNKNMTIGVIAVLVIILGGIGIFALTSDSDDSAEDTNTSTSQTAQPASQPNEAAEQATPAQNIVELAVATDALSTLVTAVTEADLVETLSGDGPFTVFAPTNDAFAALPEGTLDSLLLPENKEQLKAILTYHVVSGEVMSSDLSNGQVIETVQGGTLTVNISGSKVMLEDATGAMAEVVTADVKASNGVVHVIDSVVLPE